MVFVNEEPVWGAFAWIALVFAINSISNYFSRGFTSKETTPTQYLKLKKPPLSPPSWLFAIVWPILYILLGLSAYFVWSLGGWNDNVTKLVLFVILNIALVIWTLLYFGLSWRICALIWLVCIFSLSLGISIVFGLAYPLAAYLQIPFNAWLLNAMYLNAGTVYLNDYKKSEVVIPQSVQNYQFNNSARPPRHLHSHHKKPSAQQKHQDWSYEQEQKFYSA